ncbi:hypothetical protein AJ88_06950 [Mesorhizobium amorphae CCBAU 01583]|nr:hypothetical protein AJ88_06950 [Mesorhizobium amorphae CCBAU 01583]
MVWLLCHLPGILLAVFEPHRFVDLHAQSLVDMPGPSQRRLVIVPAVMRLVQHVAAMLVLDLAVVMAWELGSGARPTLLRVAAVVRDR